MKDKNTMWDDRYLLIIIVVFIVIGFLSGHNGCSCIIDSKNNTTTLSTEIQYNCRNVPAEKLVEAHKNCLDSFGKKETAMSVSKIMNETCAQITKQLLCEASMLKHDTKEESKSSK